MMKHYEKPFTVQLEWFRADAPARVNSILERHGLSPEEFFAADAFPARALSAIRDSAAIIRLGFGVINTGASGFAVPASWDEGIMRGGSVQSAADLLDYNVGHADR